MSVTKSWDDADDQDGLRPESITICLYADGAEIDSAEVMASDGWTYTFTDLAKYAGGEEIVYSITEDAVDGYTTAISGDSSAGFTITNTHTPESSDSGTTNSGSTSGTSASTTSSSSVQTGDDAAIFLWVAIMLVAASGIAVTVAYGRKRKRNR
ncbi:MAG: Cna B-type domain-containing protein [Clostridiales bacterium]|nr:Cna B-type domain-containing protein [Clostridiales bacterium]